MQEYWLKVYLSLRLLQCETVVVGESIDGVNDNVDQCSSHNWFMTGSENVLDLFEASENEFRREFIWHLRDDIDQRIYLNSEFFHYLFSI